jgi:hypothetical protein
MVVGCFEFENSPPPEEQIIGKPCSVLLKGFAD